jgi:2-C-methyl-D-erythritol 4-phosphate cytidylyltransferase
MSNIAIILAGGVGSRVGANVPKQFIDVLGKPVLVYTIEIYQQNSEINAIEVVCHKNYIQYLQDIVKKYRLSKVKWIVSGGETFQDSCMNGVYFLADKIHREDRILIHYGAAPFTSQKIVTEAIKTCSEKGNAVCGVPCFQLMGTRDKEISKKWVNRDEYVQITCPYCFTYGSILDIYEEAKGKGLLEKVEPHVTTLMQFMGYKLYLSYGDQTNLKITTKEDLALFEGFILYKNSKDSCNKRDKKKRRLR